MSRDTAYIDEEYSGAGVEISLVDQWDEDTDITEVTVQLTNYWLDSESSMVNVTNYVVGKSTDRPFFLQRTDIQFYNPAKI